MIQLIDEWLDAPFDLVEINDHSGLWIYRAPAMNPDGIVVTVHH